MTRPDERLTTRQRTAPPIDRRSARRGLAAGGQDTISGNRTLTPGVETEQARYPGTVNDSAIMRDRRPWYPSDPYIPPPVTWVNWTEAGPIRPELHMRTVDWRTMVGNTESRFPLNPDSPTGGRHTMIPSGPASNITQRRYVDSGLSQMVPGRPNRLAHARYTGQSYSQTTVPQGHTRGR